MPGYIRLEFERYLTCGILAHGFVRFYCKSCDENRLVAFSCKGRGICSSCQTRRMHDVAYDLCENVIPYVPIRQFVLSLPKQIRHLLQYSEHLKSKCLRIMLQVIFAWQKKRAKNIQHHNKNIKLTTPQSGSVSVIQQFGSSLNLHVHYHCLVLDGVYYREESTNTINTINDHDKSEQPQTYRLHFQALPEPTQEDIQQLCQRIERKTIGYLKKKGFFTHWNENELELQKRR